MEQFVFILCWRLISVNWMARLHISVRNPTQTEGKRQETSVPSVHGHCPQFSGLGGARKFAYKLYASAS
jgi:hypothetical protein